MADKDKKDKKAKASDAVYSTGADGVYDPSSQGEEARMFTRIDLIFSQALEEDFVEQFELNKISRYTIIPIAKGKGYSQPKLGTVVWPQLNTMIMTVCDDDDAVKVRRVVTTLRQKYKTEGIACFIGQAQEF